MLQEYLPVLIFLGIAAGIGLLLLGLGFLIGSGGMPASTLFFVTSLTLAYLSSQSSVAPSSLLEDAAAAEEVVDEPGSDLPLIEGETDLLEEAVDMPALEDAENTDTPAIDEQETD